MPKSHFSKVLRYSLYHWVRFLQSSLPDQLLERADATCAGSSLFSMVPHAHGKVQTRFHPVLCRRLSRGCSQHPAPLVSCGCHRGTTCYSKSGSVSSSSLHPHFNFCNYICVTCFLLLCSNLGSHMGICGVAHTPLTL